MEGVLLFLIDMLLQITFPIRNSSQVLWKVWSFVVLLRT
jgi:hypothetical protein